MVIAVILILVGLALSPLSRSFGTARTLGHTAAIQQAAALIELYLQDSRDVYPLAEVERSVEAAHWFYQPLVAAGLIENPLELDAEGFALANRVNMAMSECVVYDADKMIPGRTEPESQRRATPVRSTEVVHPSGKGTLYTIQVTDGRVRAHWCCIAGSPPGPVAFADGSVGVYRWQELLEPHEPFYMENGIGAPVATTWRGVRGRDRH